MKDFDKIWAYVIGGSSGIGLAVAAQLLTRGANVVIFGRRLANLKEAAQALDSHVKPGRRLLTHQLDVTIDDYVRDTITDLLAETGAPKLLVNCAGRSYTRRFEDVSYEIFDATLKVNLYGTRNTCAALVPAMIAAGGGTIVNVSSIAGFIGLFGFTNYCAAKFGVIGFSEALRNELKPVGIDVRVLCPPDTDTPGLHLENETKPEATRQISEKATLMSADEVAQALLKGLAKNTFMIIPGPDGRTTWRIKRFLPGVVYRVLDSMVAKALAQGAPRTDPAPRVDKKQKTGKQTKQGDRNTN
jgi:short-subunit dehydrogenase